MSTETPLENLAAALAHASYEGFSEIFYQDRDWEHFQKTKEDRRIEKRRRPQMRDITVVGMFPQTWGSTALGFGGIGGAAMTTAYTIVLECGRQRAVYFGGRFAYLVDQPNQAMLDDITKQQMAKVGESKKYERSTKLPEKREWCYVIPPKVFEVAPCDCGNHETMWSEYKGKIWCPICEKDFTPQHNGVFDDQIPAKLATILGLSFDRYIIVTGVVEKYDTKQLGWVKEVRTGNAI